MLNISTKPTASLRQGLEKASGSTPFYVDHEKKKSRVAQSIEPQLNLVFGAIKGSRGQIVLFNKQPKEKSPLVTFFLSNEKQNKTKQTHKKEANKKSNKHKSLFRVARERALYLVMTMMVKRHARAVHARARVTHSWVLAWLTLLAARNGELPRRLSPRLLQQ